MIGLSEESVIDAYVNVSCSDCGLIYKQNWFTSAQLDALFKQGVPMHPKGWDVTSGRFSADNFLKETKLFEKAINDKDKENINRYKRALSSILDSVDGFLETPEGSQILQAIQQERPEAIYPLEDLLQRVIQTPAPFKRFSGFSAVSLWNFIEKKCGPIRNYAELGCPLWGLLPLAAQKQIPTAFLKRNEVNYWSDNCQQGGQHCTAFLNSKFQVPLKPWTENPKDKQHVIGFFQYLDHLEKPMEFMEEVFEYYEVAAVILDGVDQPLAIQHFTGFTEQSLQYIANKFGKQIHTDFKDIQASGNVLYLFT
ncbi:hypothetical protein A3SI_06774 [Nitritalea halalkaliphila LW7]|uniref:Uncharacterized protein n=1 Tax=Nitritalea halalkaliphila LW7 TaxID=1189621 RepID=I5C618_9BACT|nr:hypothetical protein [Nitritalea halalkaliphila]EIM77270.1 hypothetical protein A3SI_06774 [Nitritalea halalkaliphila LW7]